MNYKGIYILQLIISTILILWSSFYSIQHLSGLYTDISNLNQLEINKSQTDMELNSQKSVNDELKKSLSTISPEKAADNLLSFMANQSGKLSLDKMAKTKVYNEDRTELIELKMVLKGGFKEVLGFLNELEKRPGLGQIVSLEMEKKKISKSQAELYNTIIINVLSQNNHD